MRRLVSLAVACALAGTATVTTAGLEPEEMSRLRPTEPEGQRLIDEGLTKSPTFRRLVARLRRSDVIVYVTIRPDMSANRGGALRFLGVSATDRFVHVSLNGQQGRPTLVALLGHELQHAVEVADAPEVSDEHSLSALYRRIGVRVGTDAWDSRAARDAGQLVRTEVLDRGPETRLARHERDRHIEALLSGGGSITANR